MARADTPGARGELEGRVRVGGAASVARFARALGLEQLPPPWAVRSVVWSGDHVDVAAGPSADRVVVLQIAERVAGAEGLVAAEHLVVRARGSGVPGTLERLLRRAVPARLAGATLEKLAAALLADPELHAPPEEALRALFDAQRPAERPATCLDGLLRPLGPSGRAAVEALLGLAQGPWRVRAAAWNLDRLELDAAAGPDGGALRLRLEPAGGGLRLAYDAALPPPELLERIGARAAALAETEPAAFARALAAAPDFGTPGLPVPEGLPGAPPPAPDDAAQLALLQGAELEAGEDERARFGALLALERVPGLAPLRTLRWSGDRLRFTLGRGRDEAGFALRADGSRLALEAEPGTPAAWAESLAARVAGPSLAGIAALLGLHRPAAPAPEAAPEAGAEGSEEPAPARPVDDYQSFSRMERLFRAWHRLDPALRFFYPEPRSPLDALQLGPGDWYVNHQTQECSSADVGAPLADALYFRTRRRDPVLLPDTSAGQYADSSIDGATVAGGRTQQSLDEAVARAAGAPGARAVAVAAGCLPIVVGDSVGRALQRARAAGCGAKLYVMRTWQLGERDDVLSERLTADRFAQTAPPGRARDPRTVALLGSGSLAENEELFGLVRALGLTPVGPLLPNAGLPAFERVADAAILLWANRRGLDDARALGVEGLPVREVRPATPVGLAATRAWVEALGRAAQVAPERVAAALEQALPAEALADLRARAGRFALAFVADPVEAGVLLDSDGAKGLGFRPFAVLHELGFRTRLLGVGDAAAFGRIRARLEALPAPERPELRLFEDPAGLRPLLAEPDTGAVFSSFSADPRAAAAGRCSFAEDDFEMGFAGLLRTGRRLLDMCERRPLAGLERYLGGPA